MLLTDLEMPEMDGFTLTRMVKEDDLLKGIPVVIHSSLSGSANESHAKRVGADGFVAKFVPDELVREVLKAISLIPA
jgi:two-component system chemotaxis response regulator CheV